MALLSRDWIAARKAPSGFDLRALKRDLALLRGTTLGFGQRRPPKESHSYG